MRTLLTRLSDWMLERRIRRECAAVREAKTLEEARLHAGQMRDLIALRSLGQIGRMERRRGLV